MIRRAALLADGCLIPAVTMGFNSLSATPYNVHGSMARTCYTGTTENEDGIAPNAGRGCPQHAARRG